MEREMQDNSVVVNFNQYDRSRRGQPSAENLTLLNACRDLLIEGVTRVLNRQSEGMENALLAMADRSPMLDTRNAYYAAQSVLNKQMNELLSGCKEAYYKKFSGAIGVQDSFASAGLSELSLVGDTDLELTLAVDKATSRLRFSSVEQLVALDTRMSSLLGRSDLSDNDNPLGPKVLCQALLDGFDKLGLEQNVQVVLLNQFDLLLASELPRIYQSINVHLSDHGILPDLKMGSKTRPGGSRTDARPVATAEQIGNDMFSMFERLAQSAPGAGSPAPAGAGGIRFNLLDSLGQLQNGPLQLPGGTLFELPILEANTIQNVLRSLQQSPVMQSASPLDAVMVDAVAMLFDVVFNEDAIPDRLKAQIARLQIPVLKAAMLDRSFFSQREHPVRRMLDAIAALSVRIAETEAGQERLNAISEIVTRVLKTFEKDIGVFETAAEELEALDAALDSTLDVELQKDIAEIKRAERAELAPVVVHDFINRALNEQSVSEAIRTFLRRDWAQLLTVDYVNDGETGAHFNSHVETMRELVWSVQPKADMDARLMLVRILPGLLKRLREGVASIDMKAEQSEIFFATLVILHANAVRPGNQPVPLPEVPEAFIESAAETEAASLLATPERTEAAAAEAVPEVEDEFTLRARNLEKGAWVEFHYDDGTFRWARLGWVSGIKNTYLFSDQDGLNSFSIGLHRLADKLRRGEAVVVERKSITESAFGKLFNMFRQKLGYA
jgi:hypothetical protein